MPQSLSYRYRVTVLRVIDGDTIDVKIDLGFYVSTQQRLRFARINTPELRSSNEQNRVDAKIAKEWLQDRFIKWGGDVFIESKKTGKYGRWIAEVWCGDVNIIDEMLKLQLGEPYEKNTDAN